jgi:phosphoribosylformylglycinamidine (FGAM) synthase-like enzyme
VAEHVSSSPDDSQKYGLSDEEFLWISDLLGRLPNPLELFVFSVIWSEKYCSKNSIVWLKKLPRIVQKFPSSTSFVHLKSHALVLRHIRSTQDFLPAGQRLALLGNRAINSFELPVRAENCDYADGLFEVVQIKKDAPLENKTPGDVLILVKKSNTAVSDSIEALMEIESISGIHTTGSHGLLPALIQLCSSVGLAVNIDQLKFSTPEKALNNCDRRNESAGRSGYAYPQ